MFWLFPLVALLGIGMFLMALEELVGVERAMDVGMLLLGLVLIVVGVWRGGDEVDGDGKVGGDNEVACRRMMEHKDCRLT